MTTVEQLEKEKSALDEQYKVLESEAADMHMEYTYKRQEMDKIGKRRSALSQAISALQ